MRHMDLCQPAGVWVEPGDRINVVDIGPCIEIQVHDGRTQFTIEGITDEQAAELQLALAGARARRWRGPL